MVHIPLIRDNKDSKQLTAAIAVFRRKVLNELNQRADIESVNSYYAACKAMADRCREELRKAGVDVPDITTPSLISSHSPHIILPVAEDMDLTALNTVMRDMRAAMSNFSVMAESEMANMAGGMESLLVSTSSVEDSSVIEDMRDEAASLVSEALSEGADITEIFDQALKDADMAIRGAEELSTESASNFGGLPPPSSEEPEMMRERVEELKDGYDTYLEAEGEYNQAKELYDSLVDEWRRAQEYADSIRPTYERFQALADEWKARYDEAYEKERAANAELETASMAVNFSYAVRESMNGSGEWTVGLILAVGEVFEFRVGGVKCSILNNGDATYYLVGRGGREGNVPEYQGITAGFIAKDTDGNTITGAVDVPAAEQMLYDLDDAWREANSELTSVKRSYEYYEQQAEGVKALYEEEQAKADALKAGLDSAEKAMAEAEQAMREAADTIASNL